MPWPATKSPPGPSCLIHEPERSRAASTNSATGAPRVPERRTPLILPRRPVGRPRQEGPGPVASKRHRGGGEGGRMGAQGYSCEPETPPSTTGIHLTHPLNDDEVVRTPNARNSACWSWHSARRCTGSDSRAAGWCRQLPPKRPSRSTNDVESSDIGVDQARRHGARRATRDSLAERQI